MIKNLIFKLHKVNLKCNRKAENDNRKWINKITKYKSTKSKIQNIIFCILQKQKCKQKDKPAQGLPSE